MKISTTEMLGVLDTLTEPEFSVNVAEARRVLEAGRVQSSKNERAVPVASLDDIYRTRRSLPSLPSARVAEFDKLLAVLGRSPNEAWFIYTVGEHPLLFAVFANEDGIARACICIGPP